MLDLVVKNEKAVSEVPAACESVLYDATQRLTVIDPVLGETDLVKSVAVELAKLSRMVELSKLH